MDWNDVQNGGILAGLAAAVVAVWHRLTGHHEQRIGEIAITAVRASGQFTLAAEQAAVNDHILDEMRETRDTVRRFDDKLDRLLMAGFARRD